MINEFTFHGQWFLPESPDKIVAGNLKFNAKENPELLVFGTLYENGSVTTRELPLILGRTTTGQIITLYKGFEYKRKMQNGVVSSIYSVLYVFINSHYYREQALKFTKIEVKFKGMDAWIRRYGFEVNNNFESNEVQINYKRPSDILTKIDDKVAANICFSHSFPLNGYINEANVSQEAYLQFKFSENVSFDFMMNYVALFQNLLTLGTFEPAYPLAVNVYSNNSEDDEDEICSVLEFKPDFNYAPNNERGVNLFYFDDMEPNFPEILRKWFSLGHTIEPVLDLLLNSFYNRNLGLDVRFLQIAQALETFHRRLLDKKPFDEKEFKKWAKGVVENVDQKYKEMLRGKLNFSNEQPLHARLEECIDKLEIDTIKQIVGDKTKFIRDVKNSRNYLTHYSVELANKALRGNELYQLTDRLRIVLLANILLQSGFELKQINEVIKNNGIYLFNHIYKPIS